MIRRLLVKLSTRHCDGRCGDASFHTHHLTIIGRRRYS